jgi:hypothetical protein
MSTTARPVDIAPQATPRPTLALVLALLAVPGSTLAWDLPAGGLWIGVPLGVAAIVVAGRSREAGPKRAIAATVIAGLCLLQMAVWTVVSAF